MSGLVAFWTWRDVEFRFAVTIEPLRDTAARILVCSPQSRYTKKNIVPLNYGAGPFCECWLAGPPHSAGVYVYIVSDEPVYVGQAVDLNVRFYAYGHISPKNCYRGRRETNSRMNTLIYDRHDNGGKIHVCIVLSPDYADLEKAMISDLKPKWNRSGVS